MTSAVVNVDLSTAFRGRSLGIEGYLCDFGLAVVPEPVPAPETTFMPTAVNFSLGPRQIADEAKRLLGINRTSLARVLNIARPTIYTHITDNVTPDESTLAEYRKLAEVLEYARSRDYNFEKSARRYIIDGDTLLGHLQTPNWSADTICNLMDRLAPQVAAETSSVHSNLTIDEVRRKALTHTKSS